MNKLYAFANNNNYHFSVCRCHLPSSRLSDPTLHSSRRVLPDLPVGSGRNSLAETNHASESKEDDHRKTRFFFRL
jgi:hypothetical protein